MVMDVLAAFSVAAASVSLAASTYLVVLTVSALGMSPKQPSLRPPRNRMAILIPAHNEEALLPRLLASLAALDYPKELWAAWVVADNCTDATAVIAETSGARVFERFDRDRRGKGFALDDLISRVAASGEIYDVFVFLDADSEASPNLLRTIDTAFQEGARAVQVHYAVSEPKASEGALIRSAAMLLVNFLRPLGRRRLGCSAGIKGTGMAIEATIARDRHWGGGLAEDAEYHARLLLQAIVVQFEPAATVTAHVPPSLKGSTEQNKRWEAGRLAAAAAFAKPLLIEAIRRRSLPLADAALDLLIPPLSILAVWMVGSSVAGLLFSKAALVLSGIAALGLLIYVLGGLAVAGATRAQFAALLTAPRLVIWKVALYARLLVRRGPTSWIRTDRSE